MKNMQYIKNRVNRGISRLASCVSHLTAEYTNRDLFTVFISVTIICLGSLHLLVTHDMIPKALYMDADLAEAREYERLTSPSDDASEAVELFGKVRVVCMVMTSREHLWTRAVHVNNTWGRRCNKIVFMSDVSDPEIPSVVGVYTSTGKNFLAQKVFESFDYIYDHHLRDAEWFLKCDDDSYVIMENLRHFLMDKNYRDPVFYGQLFRNTKRINYFPGGATYVLSKSALQKFRNRDEEDCMASWEGANEDVRTSECLLQLGVSQGDSRDEQGRTRFHTFSPMAHLMGEFPSWYRFRSIWGAQHGADTLSSRAISFHQFESVKDFYLMEYLIYQLRPYGIKHEISQNGSTTAMM